jgi:CheY-like chemotaxis protein
VKILIADDNAVSRKIMRAMAERLGYRVVEAKSGVEAWRAFQRHPIRIVISDWMMPGMSGVELCQKIRSCPKSQSTFFFLISGKKTGLGDFAQAHAAGADDFIYKPLDFYVVRNQIERAEQTLGLLTRDLEHFHELRDHARFPLTTP